MARFFLVLDDTYSVSFTVCWRCVRLITAALLRWRLRAPLYHLPRLHVTVVYGCALLDVATFQRFLPRSLHFTTVPLPPLPTWFFYYNRSCCCSSFTPLDSVYLYHYCEPVLRWLDVRVFYLCSSCWRALPCDAPWRPFTLRYVCCCISITLWLRTRPTFCTRNNLFRAFCDVVCILHAFVLSPLFCWLYDYTHTHLLMPRHCASTTTCTFYPCAFPLLQSHLLYPHTRTFGSFYFTFSIPSLPVHTSRCLLLPVCYACELRCGLTYHTCANLLHHTTLPVLPSVWYWCLSFLLNSLPRKCGPMRATSSSNGPARIVAIPSPSVFFDMTCRHHQLALVAMAGGQPSAIYQCQQRLGDPNGGGAVLPSLSFFAAAGFITILPRTHSSPLPVSTILPSPPYLLPLQPLWCNHGHFTTIQLVEFLRAAKQPCLPPARCRAAWRGASMAYRGCLRAYLLPSCQHLPPPSLSLYFCTVFLWTTSHALVA